MTPDQDKALSDLVRAPLKLLANPKLPYSNPGEPVLTGELGHLLNAEFPEDAERYLYTRIGTQFFITTLVGLPDLLKALRAMCSNSAASNE